MEQGKAGGKGVKRYSFLDAVAADAARLTSREFNWSVTNPRRVAQTINSGDKRAVRDSEVIVYEDHTPGTVSHHLFDSRTDHEYGGFDKLSEGYVEVGVGDGFGRRFPEGITRLKVLKRVSLMEIVEWVADSLYDSMVRLGFDFSGVVGAVEKKAPGRRN